MTARLKALTAAAAVALALALTGCGSGGDPATDDDAGKRSAALYERTISLTDGRTVTCVTYKAGYAGGLSCDWGGAR